MDLQIEGKRYAILVDKPPVDEAGKIIIPDSVKKDESESHLAAIAPTRGKIAYVGNGFEEFFEIGTVVHFVRFVGQALPYKGEVYLIVRDTDILAAEVDNSGLSRDQPEFNGAE